MCWQCHRAYAVDVRGDRRLATEVVRGIVIGLVVTLGALGAGAPGFFAIAVVPIAMAFGSRATRRHRRAWIERQGPALPEARLLTSLAGVRGPAPPDLASPREPDSGTHR